jgi:heme oxygenase
MMDNPSSMSRQQSPHIAHQDQPGALALADFLRAHTQPLHALAERSGIVRDLLKGQADRRGYAIYLRNILPAYRELEAALERNRAIPGLARIARRELYRAPALESDLRALLGQDWEKSLPLLPAGERYRRRIAKVAEAVPTRLIAYAYVRYLGDLNGGLILRRLLARALELPDSALTFYDFPLVDDLAAAKQSYRAAFDQAGREIQDMASIANEAAMAFRLNIGVSQSVHDLLTGAADTVL